MIEKEEKFILKYMPEGVTGPVALEQGYLIQEKGKHLRIRITDHEVGVLTIKHSIPSSNDRHEFEYTIPIDEAKELMALCPYKLSKLRFQYPDNAGRDIVIDVYPNYYKNNIPLMIVEVEYINTVGKVPDFCGKCVSNKRMFGNLSIAKKMSKIK